jgi:predicted PurR-regulated permease PerM
MSVYSYKQRNTVVLAILIILGCFILYSLRSIAGSLLSTIVLYTIFRPVYLHATENLNIKKWLAAVLIMIFSLVIIVLPFLALSLMVISKHNQPDLLDKGMTRLNGLAEELFPSILGGAASIFLGLIVMYFLLYFMFTKREDFEGGLLKYAPFNEQNAIRFGTELKTTTYSNVLGQGFIAVVQGALVSLTFFAFGIRDPIFWGVISTFLSFLPVVGSPIVFVPAALIELANGNTTAGWGILLVGFIVIINIDNVLRLLIAKRVADTHPIITVVGVIIGIPVFGIIGLVFGPLLLSYFILTIRIYETSKLASERLERIKSLEDE